MVYLFNYICFFGNRNGVKENIIWNTNKICLSKVSRSGVELKKTANRMVYDQLFAVRFYSDPENKNQTF